MAYEELLTRDVADVSYLAADTSVCRPFNVTLAANTATGATVTLSEAKIANPPLIAKISGTDVDYAKITSVNVDETTKVMTFTLSSSLTEELKLLVIDS